MKFWAREFWGYNEQIVLVMAYVAAAASYTISFTMLEDIEQPHIP